MSNTAKVVIIAMVGLLGFTMGFLLCFFLLNRPGKEEEKDWEDAFDVWVEPSESGRKEDDEFTIRNVSNKVAKNIEVKFYFICYEDPMGKERKLTVKQKIDRKLMSGESVTISIDYNKYLDEMRKMGRYIKFEWDDVGIKEIAWE